jgi:circadian clock protein KaiC
MNVGEHMQSLTDPLRILTGISGLDEILSGGLSKGHTYLVEGSSGSGKTTMGMQFVIEGKRAGESCLYVTLSESIADLNIAAESHDWSLDGIAIAEFVPDEASLQDDQCYTVFHPGEVELATTTRKLLAEIERVGPDRLVVDSLSEFGLLAGDPVKFRRQLLALKQFFAQRNTTVLLLNDHAADGQDEQVHSIVHGVIRCGKVERSYGRVRRHLEIVKLRSSAYLEGYHDYSLDRRGVVVYPRLVAAGQDEDFAEEHLSSNLPALDAMFAGGIERGSSTLVLGPSGVGKSSIVMQYAYAAATRGERAVIYSFEETFRTARMRAHSLGMWIDPELQSQRLCIEQMDAAGVSPGEFAWKIRREVEERKARVIIIDSLNGFLRSMSGEADLAQHLHELLSFLNQKGIDTFLVLTQQALIGERTEPVDVSYLADTVLILRYFEVTASVRRAISVLKKRSGAHESTIRELRFSSAGIQVGEPLAGFKGILSGLPDSVQAREPQMEES